MPVIAVANQKGGVGKTATTFNLGHAFFEHGRKVLMIDIDPQGSLTDYAGYEPSQLENTVYQVLHGHLKAREAMLQVSGKPDLIPSNIDLAAVELELAGELQREFRLLDVLEDLLGQYDYILIDCPPSLGLLTINALIAARWVLIPVATQYSALRGLERLYETIAKIQKRPNPDLEILGIIPTLFDQRTLHSKEALELIEERSGDIRVFSPIPYTVRMQESPVAKKPIFLYEPGSKAGKAYQNLALEVINECEKG